IDSYGRVLRDLRVSVTDRCNFRCMYCLPETEAAQNFYRGRWATLPQPAPLTHQWQPRSKILTFEEIERIVRIALNLGVQKIRLSPVKVNSVVIRGINDHEIEALAEFGRSRGLTMRFIEFMPLDSGRVWLKELVVPGKEILARIQARFSLFPIKSENKSETA